MRTRTRTAGAMLTLMVASTTTAWAQQPRDPAHTRRRLPVEEVSPSEAAPLAVVVQFLGLAPQQAEATAELLRQRQQALAPILLEIARREQRIQELIASGGDPAEIGTLLVQIHQLRQQAGAVQAQFLAAFESLLSDAQRARWQQIRLAARLQPVLPAFQALQML